MTSLGSNVQGHGLDVGFLCQGWPPDAGEVETQAAELARELTALGHRVHVLCLDPRSDAAPYSTRTEEREGSSVRRVACRHGDPRAVADLARNTRMEEVLAAWLAETPCDVVHVHHLSGFGTGALGAVADLGQPLVATLHDDWLLCPRSEALAELGRAHRIHAPSEAAREVWVREGIARERIQVVPNSERARWLEGAYVELIRAVTGRTPALPERRSGEPDGPARPASASAAETARPRSWLGRLLGRD